MATATKDPRVPTSANEYWRQSFSEAQWRDMLDEDIGALRNVSIVLASVIFMGFVAIVATVLWVL